MSPRRASRTADTTPLVPGPAPAADTTTGVAVGDQVALAAHQAALAAGDITPDPFTPQPLDAATLTGTPAERLALVEAALRAADDHATGSVKAAKARWTIEKGAALRILVDQDLYTARGHASLAAYADEVLHTSRDNVYKTIEAAEALRAILAAPRVSKIFDTPPNASQAKALVPVLALDSGEDKAVEIVTDVKTSGRKLTAAALTAAARRLGYAPPRPAPKSDDGQDHEQQRPSAPRAADAVALTVRLDPQESDEIDAFLLELRREAGLRRLDKAEAVRELLRLAREHEPTRKALLRRLR
ncbi:hypothetical protein [Streptomyces cinereoruber]|uniref:hypothetical protein n=1 Tax=Streptomyces cinereoruber TaxID=67260 RepID=UPI003659D6A6